MSIRFPGIFIIFLTAVSTQAFSQSAGNSVLLQYGNVEAVDVVQAKSRHARGALIGGIGGAVLSHGHPGLGAVAGGLIGGRVEGHHTGKQTLQRYTVSLTGGGTIVIDTEQHDIVVGDCVVVEQGQYANIRRVSSINCHFKQQPEHHVSAANNCQKAKDELNNAKDNAAVENAVIKVRTLCED